MKALLGGTTNTPLTTTATPTRNLMMTSIMAPAGIKTNILRTTVDPNPINHLFIRYEIGNILKNRVNSHELYA